MEEVKKYILENGERIEVGTYIRDAEWNSEEDNQYIVGINNWIINSEGKFLAQRRALTKKNNPGKWSSTNGLVQLAEDSIDTVIRETKEELGITIDKNQISLFEKNHVVWGHLMVDIFITCIDVDLDKVTIQKEEVDKICFVTLEELITLDISTTCSYIKTIGKNLLDQAVKQFSIKP